MSTHTRYGYCKGCNRWVPRDEMGSINVFVYSDDNEKHQIKLRFCPVCHKKKAKDFERLEWVDELKMEYEVLVDSDVVTREKERNSIPVTS